MRLEQSIGGKSCYIYSNDEVKNDKTEKDRADIFLIQAVGEHELETLDREVEIIKELSPDTSFTFVAFLIEDWNNELSPWEAPAVFGKDGFGGGGDDTFSFLTNKLIPEINDVYKYNEKADFYIGGYSLSGLFALWTAYQTDIFCGIAAVSPSVWFPDWDTYMASQSIQASKVYLSLGDKEEKAKNKIMSKVGLNIRKQYELICKEVGEKACVLEWNPGNHFVDSETRTAKGFAWLLNRIGE